MLSEFRDRLTRADAGLRVLDGVLAAAREKGLLKSADRAGTDSTHVSSAAREPNWLELVAETLRWALNALAQAAPGWLVDVAEPDWFRHPPTHPEHPTRTSHFAALRRTPSSSTSSTPASAPAPGSCPRPRIRVR